MAIAVSNIDHMFTDADVVLHPMLVYSLIQSVSVVHLSFISSITHKVVTRLTEVTS